MSKLKNILMATLLSLSFSSINAMEIKANQTQSSLENNTIKCTGNVKITLSEDSEKLNIKSDSSKKGDRWVTFIGDVKITSKKATIMSQEVTLKIVGDKVIIEADEATVEPLKEKS